MEKQQPEVGGEPGVEERPFLPEAGHDMSAGFCWLRGEGAPTCPGNWRLRWEIKDLRPGPLIILHPLKSEIGCRDRGRAEAPRKGLVCSRPQ